jgi:hypothetical protein
MCVALSGNNPGTGRNAERRFAASLAELTKGSRHVIANYG